MRIVLVFRILLFILLVPFLNSSAFAAADYRIACYFNDTDESIYGQNPKLMWPSKVYLGASKNYYWALNTYGLPADYTKLTGNIEDGFFIEQSLTYDDVVQRCRFAIDQGVLFWPSRSSYKLYDFKASLSNVDGYEYPIQFAYDKSSKYKINKIVVFGDSLSDTGNLKRWTKVMPYYPYWYGRFSDGFIWDDYLSSMTHLPILNFAFGGAKTEGTNNIYLDAKLLDSLKAAVKSVVSGNTHDYVNTYLDRYLTTDSYTTFSSYVSDPQKTLFVVWIGGNDYAESLLFPDLTQNYFDIPNGVGGINQVQVRAVQNIIDQISALNSSGAYHFLVLNLPDMGKIPLAVKTSYQRYDNDVDNVNYVSKFLTKAINKHNYALNDSLKKLQSSLGNKIDIVYLDINEGLEMFVNNKNFIDHSDFDYGSSVVNSKYKVPDSNAYIPDTCYKSSFFNAAFTENYENTYNFAYANMCQDSEGERLKFPLFWDKLHPSSYTHCWLAYAIEHKLIQSGLISETLKDMNSYKDYCYSKVTLKDLME